jgi:phage tail-like protein
MNFVVSIGTVGANAAFTEVTGIDAAVDVIEFRQGNANSLAPLKIPGLVKHGNITLKYGVTDSDDFRNWIRACTYDKRKVTPRTNMTIELIDIIKGSPLQPVAAAASSGTAGLIWTLTNCWVAKYTGSDLNALQSEIAIETVEVAYEEISVFAGGADPAA